MKVDCKARPGTLRCHDGDDNENVKKPITLNIRQNNNSARASHFFCTFLCLHCRTTTGKCLISLFKVMLHEIRTIRNDDF